MTTNPAVQLAILAINSAVGESPDDKTALIAAKCRALITGYDARWQASDYIPTDIEAIVSVPLLNPATAHKSRDLQVAGKIDVLATRNDKVVLIDHKTTSDDIADPASSYWRQLVVEAQPSHYCLLLWQSGVKVDETVWDCIRKPSIAPRQLKTKAERALIVANRKYCGVKLSDATMSWLQENDRENLEMYEARLVEDCTTTRPDYYFQRRSLPRLDSELLAYADDLWDAGQFVLEARRKDRWPKHPRSCMAYGSPCTYLGICSGFDRADSPNWQQRESVHSELTPDTNENTLTYSSITTYQTCPRKFYYRYELGIERIAEEEREALFFGSTIHKGLEAYWRALMPVEKDNGYSNTCAPNSGDNGCAEALTF